jgi:hypothetical protein
MYGKSRDDSQSDDDMKVTYFNSSQYVITEAEIADTERDIHAAKEEQRVNVKANTYQIRAERNMSRGEYSAAIDECQMGKQLLASCSKERHKDG